MPSEDIDLFEDLLSPDSWKPPTDVCETATEYILKVEVPGVEKEDVQLSVQENRLQITGQRKFGNVSGEDDYQQLESFRGRFRRAFTFPASLDSRRSHGGAGKWNPDRPSGQEQTQTAPRGSTGLKKSTPVG